MTIKEEILSNKVYIMNICCMCIVWASASFGYYLIGYDLKYIRGNKYINGIISSSSECVAFLAAGVLIEVVGVKKTLIGSYILALIGMVSLIATTTDDQVALSFMILGAKFGVSVVFVVAYVGNYSLFPGTIVATTMGICNIFSRISTIFAPYVAEVKPDTTSQVIFCVIMAMALVSSFAIQVMKKTAVDDDDLEEEDHVTEAVEKKTNQEIIDFTKNEIYKTKKFQN